MSSFLLLNIAPPPAAAPPTTAAGAAVTAAPVIPMDVKVANQLPAATLPIVACVAAAIEPAATPK